jgi:glycosyltransferase involved in cell wall biosynthesis
VSETPLLSVVICTHDRASYLRTALASLAAQRFSRDAFELLVVDNRSTDPTPAVVAEFVDALPVRRVPEGTLGLCHARNTGWREARGRYVAYFDDDAVADPGWLAAVRDGFARAPGAGVLGGPVRPIWEAPRPAWLSDEAARALTIVQWPGGAHVIADLRTEWLAGANMAVPRALLERIGGFHPRLDRVGHNMLSSGDVFLQRQIQALGYPVVYEPAMSIGHVVPPGRLTKEWFRRRYYWQGISDVVMQLIEQEPRPARRAALALARAARLARSPRQLRTLVAPGDDPAAFTSHCWAWITVGQMAGLLGKARL